MDLSSLLVSEKIIKAQYPEPSMDGFTVSLAYISRDEIQKIRNKCVTLKYNKRSHKPEEDVDNDLFLKLYVGKVIRGWEGLKFKYLADLMLVNLDSVANPEEEVPYSEESALVLMKNSPDFDGWVTNLISDLSAFNKNS